MLPRTLFSREIRRPLPFHPIAQVVFFAASLLVILLFFFQPKLHFFAAGLAGSAFLVFAMPERRMSQLRAILGGHALSIALGGLATLVPLPSDILGANPLLFLWAFAGAVAVLLMAAFKVLHPPAIATFLGMLVAREDLMRVSACVMIAAGILVGIRLLLGNRLRDLA